MKPSCLLGGGLMLMAVFIEIVQPTCVLESDFGFKINCAFKKSGLFRVRNLGGVKAHASIGFSLGDELGFEQSLTNLDTSRRRSVNIKNGAPVNVVAPSTSTGKQEKRGKQNRIIRPQPHGVRPNQAAMDRLASLHRKSSTMQPIIVQSPELSRPTVPTVTIAKPMPMGVPPFKPLPPKDDLAVLPIQSTRKSFTPLQIPEPKGPGLAYQSELNPQSHNQISKMVSQMTAQQYSPTKFTSSPIIVDPKIHHPITSINPFLPIPSAPGISIVSPPSFTGIQSQPIYSKPIPRPNSVSIQKHPISNFVDPVPHQVHDLAVYNTKKVDDYNSISGYGDETVLRINKEELNSKIAEIAKAGNISMEAVEAAIALRQQQLLSKYANIPMPAPKPTTTTTQQPFAFQPEPEPEVLTSALPQKSKRVPVSGKVMNAPREYYPTGYEKNFDDHFQSKVELPDTNFHCGDQKYFPGLYGDESLGCMVFHVCALTDDGLVMKSFLCPESTLFDQTILKCNWWFYVDCKNTKKLYDTNIPVSKSYQLMKALTFFSSYKKEMQEGQQSNPESVDGIKDALSMLQIQNTQANAPQPSTADFVNAGIIASNTNNSNTPNNIQFVTPTPIIDERSRGTTTDWAPVYRGNRNIETPKNTRSINNTATNPTQGNQFITLNTNINFGNNNSTENDSKEKKHRRRLTLKSNNQSTTTTEKPEAKSPLVEIMKQEIQPIEINNLQRQETLADQIDVNANIANLAPVKRFHRSSSEKTEEKEIAVVNNEKVQIVRPTAHLKLVGQNPTPSAAIEKLDDAILGKLRRKKHIVTIATKIESPKT